MIAEFTTDNISQLRANPLASPGGWMVSFHSDNAGMHHQLYVNGALADWTDTTDQRNFFIQPAVAPVKVVVAAVSRTRRNHDFSEHLTQLSDGPDWTYCTTVVRSNHHAAGARLEVLSGLQTEDEPLFVREIWPAWYSPWMWGQDRFGAGGFGFDGSCALGLGRGAFGAGMFGIDASTVDVCVPLSEEGSHQITLRTVASEGQYADAEPQALSASPPPRPPEALTVSDYDHQTHQLTLQIEGSST